MLNAEQLQHCIIWACEQEVKAPKPGNVNCYSGTDEMRVQDFINSAHAIAPILSQKKLSVGEMILQAITATRTVVDCNTNLGIVLLFAPLCFALQRCRDIQHLPEVLERVLLNLTVDDAIATYQAIRLAEAGGMGKSEQQDIDSTPTVSLRQAMNLAKDYDLIAAQYLNNYHEIFHIGLANLTFFTNCGESVEWATAFAYLSILSSVPDSLIARKYGLEYAQNIMKSAERLLNKANNSNSLERIEPEIIQWDNELKKKGINPGTTADLTATTLLLYAVEQTWLSK